jgi:hypothetical protein
MVTIRRCTGKKAKTIHYGIERLGCVTERLIWVAQWYLGDYAEHNRNQMGDRQDKLVSLLSLTNAQLSSGSLPYPSYLDISSSKFKDEIMRVYSALGGIMCNFPLNLRKWDIEADGIAVELDEDLHFNRYRRLTLHSKIYDGLPCFPRSEYMSYCSGHESDCLKAGSYGGKWTNNSCEAQFGEAATKGDLTGNGSPRWKQRAFYDFAKDLTPLLSRYKLNKDNWL